MFVMCGRIPFSRARAAHDVRIGRWRPATPPTRACRPSSGAGKRSWAPSGSRPRPTPMPTLLISGPRSPGPRPGRGGRRGIQLKPWSRKPRRRRLPRRRWQWWPRRFRLCFRLRLLICLWLLPYWGLRGERSHLHSPLFPRSRAGPAQAAQAQAAEEGAGVARRPPPATPLLAAATRAVAARLRRTAADLRTAGLRTAGLCTAGCPTAAPRGAGPLTGAEASPPSTTTTTTTTTNITAMMS